MTVRAGRCKHCGEINTAGPYYDYAASDKPSMTRSGTVRIPAGKKRSAYVSTSTNCSCCGRKVWLPVEFGDKEVVVGDGLKWEVIERSVKGWEHGEAQKVAANVEMRNKNPARSDACCWNPSCDRGYNILDLVGCHECGHGCKGRKKKDGEWTEECPVRKELAEAYRKENPPTRYARRPEPDLGV